MPHALSYMTFEEAFLNLFYSYQQEKERKGEEKWNITDSESKDFMDSEALWLLIENKTPGKRSRDVELLGRQGRRLSTDTNGLQAYGCHTGNRQTTISLGHLHGA